MALFVALLMLFSIFITPIAATPANDAEKKTVAQGTVLKRIKKTKQLVVGTSADYPPLEFTASENGKTKEREFFTDLLPSKR